MALASAARAVRSWTARNSSAAPRVEGKIKEAAIWPQSVGARCAVRWAPPRCARSAVGSAALRAHRGGLRRAARAPQ